MPKISLFVEDRGHAVFLEALVQRLANQYRIPVVIRLGSATGGYGKMMSKLTEDLVHAMNLEYLERTEDSLGKLLKALREIFKEWERS